MPLFVGEIEAEDKLTKVKRTQLKRGSDETTKETLCRIWCIAHSSFHQKKTLADSFSEGNDDTEQQK